MIINIEYFFLFYKFVYFPNKSTIFFKQTCQLNWKKYFPDIIEPIIIESVEVQDYCDTYIHPTLLKALFKIVDEKPEDPLLFLAEWLLRNNPFQPHYLDSLVALAPT